MSHFLRTLCTPDNKTDKLPEETKNDLPVQFKDTATKPIQDTKPQSSFLCPISNVLMTDPVMAMDGYTYERVAIEKWLETNSTSPTSSDPLPAKTLIPNHNLKCQIQAWKLKVEKAQLSSTAANVPDTEPQVLVSATNNSVPSAPPDVVEMDEKKDDSENVGALELKAWYDSKGLVRFSVSVCDIKEEDCPPVDLVLVMDRSGSMSTAVVGVDEDTQMVVENGFNTLDLCKHAMRTFVNALRPVDRLAIILFDSVITRAFGLTAMDKNGKNMAIQQIGVVRERNSTNIYKAVEAAVELIQTRKDKSRNPSVLFFTDGVPNISPPCGELNFFRNMKCQRKVTFPIHAFGFGAWDGINSSLLYNMAKIFDGMYGYIPDATFVGTTFVNAISNILTTAAIDVTVHVKKGSYGEMKLHIGDFRSNVDETGEVVRINVGSVRYGQSIDFLVKYPSKVDHLPFCFVTYQQGEQLLRASVGSMVSEDPFAQDHVLRFETIEMLKQVVQQYRNNMNASTQLVKDHIQRWDSRKLLDDTSMGIIEQLKGQNTKMLLKRKYMDKWGRHTTLQYIRSLNLQIKNNFKDPGVQNFGGKLFEDLSDKIDDIFNNMSPPKPSLSTKAKVVATPQAFARSYNNARNNYINGHGNTSGGCFAGDGEVMMGDGSYKAVREICPGDILATPEGNSQVLVVRKDEMYHRGCLVKGLWITPKHPMRVEGQWVCPYMTHEVDSFCPVNTWYNFELKHGNSFIINGMELVALGHNNIISPEDPAFCSEKDALYGRGWESNPERQMYLGKTYLKNEVCNSARMVAF